METIKKIVCTTCGSPIDNIDLSQKTAVCAFCGNQFVIQNAAELSKIEVDKTKDLKNNREILKSAIEKGDLKGIVRYSGKILEIIPEDYASKYYYAYAQDELGNNNKYIQEFYKTPAELYTDEELKDILSHIINNSKLRDRLMVENYIMSLENVDTFGYLQQYKKEFNQRKQKEEDYDDIVRDVFVCHRSTNVDIAELLVKALEEDGNKCWISTRNLRPNDAENYWDNISKAINSCKVFLVVSSEDAMMSGDVKNEIYIAKSLDKPRVEYKIDNSERTTFFKDFFSGKKWIEGTGDARSLTLLCTRIYDEICNITKVEVAPLVTGGISEESVMKRAKIDIQDGMFEEAEKALDKVLDMNAENAEAWWMKLLLEYRVDSGDELGVRENVDCIESRNFINAEKYAEISNNQIIITHCKRLQDKVDILLATMAEEERKKEEIRKKIDTMKTIEVSNLSKIIKKKRTVLTLLLSLLVFGVAAGCLTGVIFFYGSGAGSRWFSAVWNFTSKISGWTALILAIVGFFVGRNREYSLLQGLIGAVLGGIAGFIVAFIIPVVIWSLILLIGGAIVIGAIILTKNIKNNYSSKENASLTKSIKVIDEKYDKVAAQMTAKMGLE